MTWKTPVIYGTAILTMLTLQLTKQTNLKGKVLSAFATPTPLPTQTPIPSPTPTSIPTPTPTPRPTPTPSPTPSLIPTLSPTAIPSPRATPTSAPKVGYTSEDIYNFTNQFGGQYGIDPNVIRYVGICESGFNVKAKNGPYGGIFQFDSQTWTTFRTMMSEDPNPDLRYDGKAAVQTVAFALSKGYARLWPNCYPN